MLFYLDNHLSLVDTTRLSLANYPEFAATGVRRITRNTGGLNENYARELLELHTLGVDGGYTQQDVIDIARAFTGWTITPQDSRSLATTPSHKFLFAPIMHDAEPKRVLGVDLDPGRGLEDGEQVLDLLARHPSTARFIATKLARRFVSDDPPKSLIDRAAATFTRTDGDIAAVVRTIATSPEFYDRSVFRAKIKTPLELIVSVRRAIGAGPDTSITTARLVAQHGQPLFGREDPDGWPEIGPPWISANGMNLRFSLGTTAAGGGLANAPLESWAGWARLSAADLNTQVDGVVSLILGGSTSPATRSILLRTDPARSRSETLRDLVELTLNSPDFQRRW